ncbi:transposase [Streptomyces sp. NPDC029004]|uniref:transposase n=1 Tax=Streptomyces sp. NPDC029004 TaxID=3154490 RepID=UPI0033C8F22F
MGLGRHLAQWLVARGESVVDVPASATSRVRRLPRGGGRKNDRIDAAAAATAHIHGDGREVNVDDHTTALALLDERRVNLTQARSAPSTSCTLCCAICCPTVLRLGCQRTRPPRCCARSALPATSRRSARTLPATWVTEIRAVDKRLAENAVRIEELVDSSGSTLMNTPRVGPVLAARLVGRVGRASRFATAEAFANYTGVAPVEIASADKACHRLSRSGDRRLNSVLHAIALT